MTLPRLVPYTYFLVAYIARNVTNHLLRKMALPDQVSVWQIEVFFLVLSVWCVAGRARLEDCGWPRRWLVLWILMGFAPSLALMSEPARGMTEQAFEVLADILTWPLCLIPSTNERGNGESSQ